VIEVFVVLVLDATQKKRLHQSAIRCRYSAGRASAFRFQVLDPSGDDASQIIDRESEERKLRAMAKDFCVEIGAIRR